MYPTVLLNTAELKIQNNIVETQKNDRMVDTNRFVCIYMYGVL